MGLVSSIFSSSYASSPSSTVKVDSSGNVEKGAPGYKDDHVNEVSTQQGRVVHSMRTQFINNSGPMKANDNTPEALIMKQNMMYYNGPVTNAVDPMKPHSFFGMKNIGRRGTQYATRHD